MKEFWLGEWNAGQWLFCLSWGLTVGLLLTAVVFLMPPPG